MPADLIATIKITDRADAEARRRDEPRVIAWHGRCYLARGGAVEVIEGEPGRHRLALREFPDAASARAFSASEEYAPLLAQRLRAARSTAVLVAGLLP